jgi:hypothetical protein
VRVHFAKLRSAIEDFFFKPASPLPLGALRIGLALVLLAQAYLLRSEVLEHFSSTGIVQGEIVRYLNEQGIPEVHWLTRLGASLGISESVCVYTVCVGYVLSLLLMLMGLWTRLAVIAAWFLHLMLANTGSMMTYGADLFAQVFLFYLMWMPAGNALSLDVFLGRKSSAPSAQARLALRVLQLHLCVVYLTSGLLKATGPQWWNGELLWRAMSLPVYRQFDMSWLAHWPYLSMVAGWTTLVIELGYVIFIWPRRTRKIWVAATLSLHIGIAVLLGLGVFGAIMSVLTLTVFGVTAEPGESVFADRLAAFKRSWAHSPSSNCAPSRAT